MTDPTPNPTPEKPQVTVTSPSVSFAQLLAPFVGALTGYLAAHGLTLDPAQTAALTGLVAGAVSGVVHWVETHSKAAK